MTVRLPRTQLQHLVRRKKFERKMKYKLCRQVKIVWTMMWALCMKRSQYLLVLAPLNHVSITKKTKDFIWKCSPLISCSSGFYDPTFSLEFQAAPQISHTVSASRKKQFNKLPTYLTLIFTIPIKSFSEKLLINNKPKPEVYLIEDNEDRVSNNKENNAHHDNASNLSDDDEIEVVDTQPRSMMKKSAPNGIFPRWSTGTCPF